jgi:hypothetical protein
MSTSRLLALALAISGCAAAAAQSSPSTTSASQPLQALSLPRAKVETVRAGELEFAFPPESHPHARDPRPNDRTCYSIRSYRVTRDHPESDSTRPAGYSTCQPASRFQVKETVDSLEIVPR